MIEAKYQAQAAAAADALRDALIAVEACGADVELTEIVKHLGDDRIKLCRLFGFPPERSSQVEWLSEIAAVDPYTIDARLCDDEGMVSSAAIEGENTLDASYLDRLNHLKSMNNHPDARKPYTGDPFPCTGSAHLAGNHIRCTSPAHKPGPKPPPIAPGDTARWA